MRRTPPVLVLAVLATGALTLSACTSGSGGNDATAPGTATASGEPSSTQEPDPVGSSTPAMTSSPLADEEAEPPAGPAWLTDATSQAEAADSALVITGLRTGAHDGYDRVVVEFSGPGTPGWSTSWAAGAWTQGKGDPITVEGAHTLVLTGTGVTMPVMPEQQEIAYTGPWNLAMDGAGIGSVYLDGAFEAQFQLVVGAESTSYRVFTLTHPTRLVVDVKHPQ